MSFIWLVVATVLVWIGFSAHGFPTQFSPGGYLYVLALVFFTLHFGMALFFKLREGRSAEPN